MSRSLIISLCLALASCGDARLDGPKPPPAAQEEMGALDMTPDAQPSLCLERCANLEACGALNDYLSCQERCALDPEAGLGNACGQCVVERGCEQGASCLSEVACAAPVLELKVYLSGVTGDRPAQAMLLDWNEQPLGPRAPSSGGDAQGALFAFGDVLYPSLAYKVRYFVDVDEDGLCQPGVDESGILDVKSGVNSVVVIQYGTWDAQVEPSCEGFLTRAELCMQRCARAAECDSASAVMACTQRCDQAPVEEALRCVSCQEGRGCLQIGAECESAGGPCAPGYVAPDASLLVGLSGQSQDIGRSVKARVLHSSGRVIEDAKPVQINEEGFAMLDFGLNLWRGQTYRVELFIDRDGAGLCEDDVDAVYSIQIEIPESSALTYKIATTDQLTATTCMMTSYGS